MEVYFSFEGKNELRRIRFHPSDGVAGLKAKICSKSKLSPEACFTIKLMEDSNQVPVLVEDEEDLELLAPGCNLLVTMKNGESPLFPVEGTMIIRWVFPGKGGEIKRDATPPKLVARMKKPYPCLCEAPENARTAKIMIKGQPDDRFLEGNEAHVNGDGEASFCDFKILRSSFDARTKRFEPWVLQFFIFDAQGNAIGAPQETDPVSVVKNITQLGIPTDMCLNDIVPSSGAIKATHRIALLGRFVARNPHLKVFVNDQLVNYDFQNENTLIIEVFSVNPQRVKIYVQCQEQRTLTFLFTFFDTPSSMDLDSH